MSAKPLRAAIDQAARRLKERGVWAPKADAEELAAHVLGVPRDELGSDVPVSATAEKQLDDAVAQRSARTPIEYITGKATFGGVELAVGPGVFIPRAESEPLLTWGLELVKEITKPVVVDLCAGSGAFALAFAHHRPDALVYAVEVDPDALTWARQNAASREAAGDRAITLVANDATDPVLLAELGNAVDLVLASPPYVPDGTDLPPEWSEHQPQNALFGGDDGLAIIRHVVASGARLLRPGGGIGLERDELHGERLTALLEDSGLTDVIDFADPDGFASFITARKMP